MPLIPHSQYRPPWWLRNPHFQTIYPTLFRRVPKLAYQRERITTPDNDFLDLDWAKTGKKRLAIVLHGLEGSSESKYMPGMISAFNRADWDGVAMNFRGCSGEPNLKLRAYHSGETGDLDFVINHILQKNEYPQLILIGFSLGGNVILKYLGEKGDKLRPEITHAVTISVPVDLAASSAKIDRPENHIYLRRFMVRLQKKVHDKIHLMPTGTHPEKLRNFSQFDNAITAPIHGFEDAKDYYQKSSSRQFIHKIRIPTLLINAKNDPFLTKECFPKEAAENNPCFFLETPDNGGHVGFTSLNSHNEYWDETRALEFIMSGQYSIP